ncbi:MAG TPA: hypothetical protein VF590_15215, partial [Isosphaeraceae bacterium]
MPLVAPLTILVAVIVLAVVLARLGPGLGADFVIRHRPGGRVEVRGRLPAAKLGAIRSFFARDLR